MENYPYERFWDCICLSLQTGFPGFLDALRRERILVCSSSLSARPIPSCTQLSPHTPSVISREKKTASSLAWIWYFLWSLGTSTDGEFEQLRRRGETRPLHIWQLAHDARDSVGKMGKKTLLQMLEMQGGIIIIVLNIVCHIWPPIASDRQEPRPSLLRRMADRNFYNNNYCRNEKKLQKILV